MCLSHSIRIDLATAAAGRQHLHPASLPHVWTRRAEEMKVGETGGEEERGGERRCCGQENR